MTPQERRYLHELGGQFGFTEANVRELVKAYRLGSDVEAIATMLKRDGPIFQDTTTAFRQAAAEYKALEARRERDRERAKRAA